MKKISSFSVKFGIREEYAVEYLEQIICGNDRNSYSKADHDATFMCMKKH